MHSSAQLHRRKCTVCDANIHTQTHTWKYTWKYTHMHSQFVKYCNLKKIWNPQKDSRHRILVASNAIYLCNCLAVLSIHSCAHERSSITPHSNSYPFLFQFICLNCFLFWNCFESSSYKHLIYIVSNLLPISLNLVLRIPSRKAMEIFQFFRGGLLSFHRDALLWETHCNTL